MARLSKHGVNISRLAEEQGLSRGAVYRAFDGRASQKTLRILQLAGINPVRPPTTAGLIVPPNVRVFAARRNPSFRDVERLLSLRLKPVERMSLDELEFVYGGLGGFPDLLDWDPPPGEKD